MIVVYIILGIIAAVLLLYVFPTLLISNKIFSVLFVRNNKDKWSRACSWDNLEQQQMFDEGEAWGKANYSFHKSVEIENEGFKLVGEYFDFGFDKAVIIIPGRMETCAYSYYFAEPYKKSGYNVLAIDNRSHGLSDGRYNTLGLREYKDILAWTRMLHDKLNNSAVFYHGICIGCATALYALTDNECPDYAIGLVADGMYKNFSESFKNHLIERKKPLFPYVNEVMLMMKLISGRDVIKCGPYYYIDKLKKPILFIYSKQDTYSLPALGEELYNKCNSKKRIKFFEKGIHSHVRINAEREYDNTIIDFLSEINE